jgi:hypothetical protein
MHLRDILKCWVGKQAHPSLQHSARRLGSLLLEFLSITKLNGRNNFPNRREPFSQRQRFCASIPGLKTIESTFATVRLRAQRTKGCGSSLATLTMVFQTRDRGLETLAPLNGSAALTKVAPGFQFIDGEEPQQQAA